MGSKFCKFGEVAMSDGDAILVNSVLVQALGVNSWPFNSDAGFMFFNLQYMSGVNKNLVPKPKCGASVGIDENQDGGQAEVAAGWCFSNFFLLHLESKIFF